MNLDMGRGSGRGIDRIRQQWFIYAHVTLVVNNRESEPTLEGV
jgi:hypothetical protein